ncbi:MAG: ParB/RepB/Spo0J family partition protein [Candidatus Fibromonas sp.]|jgi:ParB family chromosome partitioning protein|nr:ParB/RepB/Spo0J family partition protein [Candidatus Fibromonas sp.]
MGKKSMGLGRGMGEILRDHSANIEDITTERPGDATKIPLELMDANPFQPRKIFNEESLLELADSIKQHGILEPVLLRKNAGRYQIVSGERRVRAARIAGLNEIEARVFDLLSDKTMAEWAIIENIQREDLGAIETANSYQQLLDSHNYTHEDLAARLNKSRATVTNSLRLLKLPEQVIKWIEEGKLSAGTARSLLSPNIKDPETTAREIIEKGFSAREAEALAQEPKKRAGTPGKTANATDPDLQNFLNFLQSTFGTKVECKSSGKKPQEGTLIIHYSSYEDLTRIQQAIRTNI